MDLYSQAALRGGGQLCSAGACVSASSLADQCPGDPLKSTPGLCGCGVVDTDMDQDGSPDCFNLCQSDPTRVAPPCSATPVPVSARGTSWVLAGLLVASE